MAGPADLFDLAAEYLSACIDSLDAIPTYEADLLGAPDRTFVCPGVPAADCCEQLTVHVGTIGEQFSGQIPAGKSILGRRNLAQLVATFTRCVPTVKDDGSPPTAAEQSEAARQMDADGWAVWNGIFSRLVAGTLFTRCSHVLWDGLNVVNPSGGCAGWTLTLRVELDGYNDPGGS